MSLFRGLMGDLEDDPFFGHHMRSMQHMNTMMNSIMADPFSMFGGGMAMARRPPHAGELMPFGFPNIFDGFGMAPVNPNPNYHSFSSSTVMTMSSGPDGRPQVYQASQSMRTAPGGIRETKKSVCDSRTGTKKLSIGHHIGERAHVMEREHNLHSGDQEERQEFINLEEEEAEDFNREWEHKARTAYAGNAIGYHGRNHRRHREELPAIEDRSSVRPRARRHVPAITASSSSSEEVIKPVAPEERAKKRSRDEDSSSEDEDEECGKKSSKAVKSSHPEKE